MSWTEPSVETKDDTPKGKMVRAPLPNIINALIQSRCCAFITVTVAANPQSCPPAKTPAAGPPG